jgi:hypothetical protein
MKRGFHPKFRLMLTVLVVMLWGSLSYAGPVTLTIYPHIQPNPEMSPSWTAFYLTAVTAIGNDLSSGGAGASAYNVISTFFPGDIVSSSGFHSWRGVVPGAYANEHGNYLGFGLHVVGDGVQQFSLAGLSFRMSSNDVGSGCPAGTSGTWCWVGGYQTPDWYSTYNPYTVGVNWGLDRARGGGDDIIYTAGDAQSVIDELVYVGIAATFNATGYPGATPQDQINGVIDYINYWGFSVNARYCMHYGETGSTCAESDITVTPEPGTMVLFAAGLLGLLVPRCLRKKR